MLFILTGDVQSGKTRWLVDLVAALEQQQVCCWGTLAPGIWIEHPKPHSKQRTVENANSETAQEEVTREKIGIENVLLPHKEKLCFAKQRDQLAAHPDKHFAATTESDHAKLNWAISDTALQIVNEHFDSIAAQAFPLSENNISKSLGNSTASKDRQALKSEGGSFPISPKATPAQNMKGILIVDEIGRLEIEQNKGLSAAVSLIEKGSSLLYEHALIVVRKTLLAACRAQFSPYWEQTITLSSTEESATLLRSLYDTKKKFKMKVASR